MSDRLSIKRVCLRSSAAIIVILMWSALAWAQTSATPRPRAAHVAPASFETVAPQDQPQEPVFRFSRPIFRLGQDFALGQGDSVREIQSVLGDVTIAGRVDDDVVVVIGSLRLESTARIGGSVVVVGGTLTIDSGASVDRDMVIVGGSVNAPSDFRPGGQQVVIGTIAIGETLRALVPWITRGLAFGRLIVPDVRWNWIAVAIFFFIYLMLSLMFASPVRTVADTTTARPLSSFLLGLLVLVLTIPAIAILAATVIGIAIVPFVLCALVVAALIGKVGVMRAIGRSVVAESDEEDSRARSLAALVIGFAVLTIAYLIPVLGFITWALTGVIGIGAASAAFRAALRREHPSRPRPTETVVQAAPPPAVASAAFVGEPAATAPVSTFAPDAPPVDAAAATPTPPPTPPLAATDLAVYPRATFLDRVAAFAVDAILVAIAVNLLDLTRHDGWFPLLLLAYHIAFWAWRGTTLGGIVIGLRVIRVQGTDLRFADALVRGLIAVFSIAALGIGCLWMLQDPEKQMWHDKIAGTFVVKVPRHLVLP
jgi:uncharacterized RDD family membrane protein YckC